MRLIDCKGKGGKKGGRSKGQLLTERHIATGGGATPEHIGQRIATNATLKHNGAAHDSCLILRPAYEKGTHCKERERKEDIYTLVKYLLPCCFALQLTVHFEKGRGRFANADNVLHHTLVTSVIRLTCILYGQIASVHDADALVATSTSST